MKEGKSAKFVTPRDGNRKLQLHTRVLRPFVACFNEHWKE